MATGYTREWIRFFTGCGIPDDVATMYTLIFYENRIQKNMLPDLNKEYLRDMGITVMGDVIAILRHAKIVHEKYVREQILSVDDNLGTEQTNESSPLAKKSTPMKRMLEHYTRKYNPSEFESVSDVQVILPNEKVLSVQKKINQNDGVQAPIKKKIEISVKPSLKEKGLEVPVPKVRRVLPENEGGYKIKMPSGTTERSKKLLEQAKKRKIKTVFDRLGESSVSSTTSDISTLVTSSTSLKNSSVFSRLGEKTSAVSSTSSTDDIGRVAPESLPYAGILKGSPHKKNIPNTTMRADEQEKSQVRKFKLSKGISVKKRLGLANQSPPDSGPPSKGTPKSRGSDLQRGGTQTKVATLKISNKLNSSNLGIKNKTAGVLTKNLNKYKVESSQGKPIVSTTTQILTADARNLKRKLDTNSTSDPSPSKKVRFGRTTHRLIPSSTSTEPTNFVKNYPKLTMIINNKAQAENPKITPGITTGSLNSDKMKQKVGVKERIGNKSVQGRLGKRVGASGAAGPVSKKMRIQDRLG